MYFSFAEKPSPVGILDLKPHWYFVPGETNVSAMSATGVPRIAYKVVK
jgi:hypothetical protein